MLPFWNPSDAFRSGSYFKPSIRTHSFCCPRLETQLYLELCAGAENGSPLQYSCLENPTDRGAWWAIVYGVAKSQTRLSEFTHSLIWKKSYDQLRQHIKRQRHYFANNGPSSQGYGFSSGHVWMWELDYKESWDRRIDAFELWCWRRLLRVPWTARRSNQSILKEISPGCSLEGLMLKLKLQYFGHLMWRADSLKRPLSWERLRAGGEGDDRGWDGCMVSLTQWTWVWVSSGSWWWPGNPGVLQSTGLQRVRHDWMTKLNWTDVFICVGS